MNNKLFLVLLITIGFIFSGCQPTKDSNANQTTASTNANAEKTPKPAPISNGEVIETYKKLYKAVNTKDLTSTKAIFSKDTLKFGEMVAGQQNKPVDEVYKNGFVESNLMDTMPEIRDERIVGDMGAVEVKQKDGRWQDVPFMKEDGAWKLAVGNIFKGNYESPGPGQYQRENPNPTMVPAPGVDQKSVPPDFNKAKPAEMPKQEKK